LGGANHSYLAMVKTLSLPNYISEQKWGTFVASVTHDCSENLRWKNFHIFIMIWQFTTQNSWMVLNVFIEKKFDKVCAKTTNFV